MIDAILATKVFLYCGYAFLGVVALALIRAMLDQEVPWNLLFTERQGEAHHLARYILLFGSVALAGKFLMDVLQGKPIDTVIQFTDMVNLDTLTGASSIAYLLAKVTDGEISSLFRGPTQD